MIVSNANGKSDIMPFTVTDTNTPSITVLYPNGGATWAIGSVQTIKWSGATSPDLGVKMTIALMNPDGSQAMEADKNWIPIYSAVAIDNDGEEFWTIPSSVAPGEYLMQVSCVANCELFPKLYDNSDTPFSIVAGTIVVPTLDVSLDASSPVSTALTPGQANVTFAKVKITAGANPVNNMNGIQIGSDSINASNLIANFKVYDGTTLLTSSAGDLTFNGSYYYRWLDVSGFSVPVYSSKVLSVVADVKSTAPAGSVRLGIAGWNFDFPGAHVSPFGTPIYGNQMTIAGATTPSITVLSPNGGEVLQIGSYFKISWSALNFSTDSTVYIELRPDEPDISPSRKVAVISPVSESYSWLVPKDIILGQYIIEIYKADINGNIDPNESVKDISDAPFSIVDALPTEPPVPVSSLVVSAANVPGTNAVKGTNNQILGEFILDSANEPMVISKLNFTFVFNTDSQISWSINDITNFELYDENGTIVAGPVDLDSSGVYIKFSDAFVVPIGAHHYFLKARVASTTVLPDNTQITYLLFPATYLSAVGQTSGNVIIASPDTKVIAIPVTIVSQTP